MCPPAEEHKSLDHTTGTTHIATPGITDQSIPINTGKQRHNSSKPTQTIIQKMKKLISEHKLFYSFEYFPPKTREGVSNLFDRLDRMSLLEPLFMDITWGAGGSTSELSLEISSKATQMGNDVMMHLTCTDMSKSQIKHVLQQCQKNGIRNILALRGDPPKGAEVWEKCLDGFSYAIDLVKYIREEFGNEFCIGVAGM